MEAQSPDLGIVEEGDEELASLLGSQPDPTVEHLASLFPREEVPVILEYITDMRADRSKAAGLVATHVATTISPRSGGTRKMDRGCLGVMKRLTQFCTPSRISSPPELSSFEWEIRFIRESWENSVPAVALLDPLTPHNIVSREFAEHHKIHFDVDWTSKSTTPMFQTIKNEDVSVRGPFDCKYWIQSDTTTRLVFASNPKFELSEFYVMEESSPGPSRFDIIIGLHDIRAKRLLIPNQAAIIAPHFNFRSELPTVDSSRVFTDEAAAKIRRELAEAARQKAEREKAARDQKQS